MSWWRDNVTQNPLLSEAKRFGRKMMGASKNKRTNYTLLGLCVIIYVTILTIAIVNVDALNAEYVTLLQTFLFCFIVPALTFGAVAGERERRSWDLLIVAPISKTQIILGKFLSSAIVILFVAAALLPLVVICGISNHHDYLNADTLAGVLASEWSSIGFGIAFSALGIFVSALMNRAFSAQATIYAVLMIWMILWPMLISLLNVYNMSSHPEEYLLWTHPFVVPVYVMQASVKQNWQPESHPAAFLYTAQTQIIFYAAIAVALLLLSIYAIRERKNRLAGKLNNA